MGETMNPVKAARDSSGVVRRPFGAVIRIIQDLALSMQFLTVLSVPVPMAASLSGEEGGKVAGERMARAAWTFPLAGLLLGAILAGVNRLAVWALPSTIADLLTVGALIALTGGLHMDGLADTCDGLFSRRPKERILEIMRDSRVGSFGVIGIVMDLLARFALLGALGRAKWPALILIPVLSRWVMVLVAWLHPYARAEGGLGKAFTEYIGARETVLASVMAMLLAPALLGWTGLILAGVAVLLALGAGRWIAGKIGGMTGDTFGAINELAELGSLLALVLLRT